VGVSRSNLSWQLNRHEGEDISQRQAADKQSDDLLKEIKTVLKTRPTYGYRRVTARLNARRRQDNLPLINHKRIYRLMKNHNLLLSRYSTKPIRVHDGNVITLHRNTRWCSDAFYLSCDNGERVQVAFSLDTCDREAMRYVASTKGIDGGMVRDLMAETVLYRFGEVDNVPHAIQWLSDNGPCYVARETVNFGRSLGLEICTTAPYSPQSNGMAEAFVKSFKRDYAHLGDLSCATAVVRQLPRWFEDYNNHAPHKGLKMLSPRQFIRLQG